MELASTEVKSLNDEQPAVGVSDTRTVRNTWLETTTKGVLFQKYSLVSSLALYSTWNSMFCFKENCTVLTANVISVPYDARTKGGDSKRFRLISDILLLKGLVTGRSKSKTPPPHPNPKDEKN